MTAAITWPVIWALTFLAAFHVLLICLIGFAHWCQILTGMGAAFTFLVGADAE